MLQVIKFSPQTQLVIITSMDSALDMPNTALRSFHKFHPHSTVVMEKLRHLSNVTQLVMWGDGINSQRVWFSAWAFNHRTGNCFHFTAPKFTLRCKMTFRGTAELVQWCPVGRRQSQNSKPCWSALKYLLSSHCASVSSVSGFRHRFRIYL